MDNPRTRSQIRRDAQTAGTRGDIIEAASALMREHGYVGTSIAAIADKGGVAVQTIYNTVGSKVDVLAAVLAATNDGARAAGLSATGLGAGITGAGNPGSAVRVLAAWIADSNERAAPLNRVVNEAAGLDPEIKELELSMAARSLHAYSEAVGALRSQLGLRPGLSDHEAATSIWALGHPQVFTTLVGGFGWSRETYENWLRSALPGVLPTGRFPAR
ncbi:TetR/AcrR family transcriptional regulator [Cryobacterium sp.]|jgi:AcrR family transcriptional regulator|uniref:TetR/AcrR family transcriptional regulator n=1 Tax=Cryobacterium sp. TaxID=1926290 RepID=UPI00261B4BBF|nr:TetR/AcrR family transcriptional regulator [Cryobacterium sp.]MCU1445667.1 TetR family transcriptional regulator [Cryobacterium sp.]